MKNENVDTDLDFSDNMEFNKRADKIKKAGVVLIALIVLSSLAGLFGYGKWTKFREGDAGGFYAEYEKILRAKKETPLKIVAPPSEEGVVAIFIEQKYFDLVSVQRISPLPVETVCGEGGYTYYFPSEGNSAKHIIFTTIAQKMGCAKSFIRSGDKELKIEQIIYP